MKYSLLVLLSLAGVALCAQTPTVTKQIIMTKEEITIESPGYPEPAKNIDIHVWYLKSYFGAKLTVTCDDIKVTENPGCSESYFMIRNGAKAEKHCGNKSGITVENTQGFTLLGLDVKGGSGAFKCRAKLEETLPHSPIIETEYNLIDQEMMYLETYSSEHPVETWVIKSEENSTIRINCYKFEILDSGGNKDPKCTSNYAEFGLGSEIKTECGQNGKVIYSSSSNRFPIRFYSQTRSFRRNVKCLATTALLPPSTDFRAIPSEEVDSREHGMRAGMKQTTCNCGRSNKRPTSRIIYGTDASENEFPWAVSLQFRSHGVHFCGGSILTPWHVISATHCVQSKRAEDIVVLVGATHLKDSPGRKAIPVSRIVNHNYNGNDSQRDISILVMKEKIQFSNTVGPICLPKRDLQMTGQYITAVGWGSMAHDEVMTRDRFQLQKTHMRVVDKMSCAYEWRVDYDRKHHSHICTWSNHTDICLGDSGGPVTFVDKETNRYFLVGLPARCDGCKLTRPSVHTNVQYFYDWIQKVISENEHSDEKTCTKVE